MPLAYMLSALLVLPGGSMAVARSVLLDSRQRGLLSNTVVLGVGAAALATALGAPLGFALARITLPHKPIWRIALAAPAVLPPYVIALASIYIGGDVAATVAGAIAVLAVASYPLSMLATEVALRRIDSRLEEAALLVATPGRVLRRISAPLAAPSVLSAALVIFVLAISEFSVPGLLRVRVFTTEVFSAFAALYDFGRATILAIPLLLASVAAAVAVASTIRTRLVTTRRALGGDHSEMFDRWRVPATLAAGGAVLIALVLPVTALARESLRSTSMLQVVADSREAVANSLLLALAGASAVTMLAACLGYARARATARVGAALDTFWIVLFTVPSTIVGIGLIGIWNQPRAWGGVYGTPAMVLLGYLARFVPVAALTLAAAVRSVPESHEEAAAAAGAGWLRTMRHIVLPQIGIGLLVVWVVAFVLAFGEVGTTILVAPPGESTLPIRVYTMTANAPPGYVAALALFQAAVVLCPLMLLGIAVAGRKAP
jgi:iron(III) transport system permease protein